MPTIVMAAALLALLFAAIFGLLEVGRQLGLARRKDGSKPDGITTMEGAALALLGLMIAFTFSGAANRFDQRRDLIVQEVTAVGTAWLRLDLLPADAQPEARRVFRAYLDHRIAGLRAVPDHSLLRVHFDSALVQQGELWRVAVAGTRQVAGPAPAQLLLPALNESFDIADVRYAAMRKHPPAAVWVVLAVLTSVCCLLAGYDMAADPKRNKLLMSAMSVLLAVTLYIIVDFEFPRIGLITLEDFDQLLIDLRAQMN